MKTRPGGGFAAAEYAGKFAVAQAADELEQDHLTLARFERGEAVANQQAPLGEPVVVFEHRGVVGDIADQGDCPPAPAKLVEGRERALPRRRSNSARRR